MLYLVLPFVLAVALLAVVYVPRWRRRAQARRAGVTLAPTMSSVAGSGLPTDVGMPNPFVPPPAIAPPAPVRAGGRPSLLTGLHPPVALQVCGLPAVAWQRDGHGAYSYPGMRLTLVVDAGVALPLLQLVRRGGFLSSFDAAHGPSGIPALEQRYRISGDVAAWAPVLGSAAVQQALQVYPLEALTVMGGRITLVSDDGIHLDPPALTGQAAVAAAVIAAVPRRITGAAAAPPPTAAVGTNLTDPDAIVESVLARANLTPEQHQAVLALVRANRSTP